MPRSLAPPSRLTDEEIRSLIHNMIDRPARSINNILQERNLGQQEVQFRQIRQQSGLTDLIQKKGRGNVTLEEANTVIDKYLLHRHKQLKNNRKRGPKGYLTPSEEKMVLAYIDAVNDALGMITREQIHNVISSIAMTNIADEHRFELSDHVTRRFVKKNNIQFKAVASVDPSHISQANTSILHAFHSLLNNYCKTMHQSDATNFPFSSFAEIPASNKLNMDEVGSNVAKIRQKAAVQQGTAHSQTPYVSTPEGNGKVEHHVTLAVTTCASGQYYSCDHIHSSNHQQYGAPGPFVIVADTAKTDESNHTDGHLARYQRNEARATDEMHVAPNRLLAGFDEIIDNDGASTTGFHDGFFVTSSPTGSQTTETFHSYAAFLVDHFQKAFDTVDHQFLIAKLSHHGIRGIVNDWFRSYLSKRSQFVSVAHAASDIKFIRHGVPQGSVLGPLFFLIYINDLPDNLESKPKVFADDTSLFSIVVDQQLSCDQLNRDLIRIS